MLRKDLCNNGALGHAMAARILSISRKRTRVAQQQSECYQDLRASQKRADTEHSEAGPQESDQEGAPSGSHRRTVANAQQVSIWKN